MGCLALDRRRRTAQRGMESATPTGMKRFAVFAGDVYYPCGGWNDYRESFDTLDEARRYVFNWACRADWWHIVDLTTREVVAQAK